MNKSERELELELKIRELQAQVSELSESAHWQVDGETVRVPGPFKPIFDAAQKTVQQFFSQTRTDPTKATIEISGERYVLLRASSLSVDFLTTIKKLYADYGEDEAFDIGRNFLFDISHVIGIEDAKNFHAKMDVTDPIAKLSAGPIHFAYSGWAFVDISPESTPHPNDEFFLKYDHPFSFEADSWIKAGRPSNHPVCIMNSGYSSGWCEQSFGMPLTAVEITCKASGDEKCTFIMAPPNKIKEHVGRLVRQNKSVESTLRIPSFFERKRVEEEMKAAREKAEESDRMKSDFLANMSHEIRSPMNGVIGMTELVLDTELTERQREYLSAARDSADSLLSVINQVLDFSRFGADGIVLDPQPFSLRSTISDFMKPFVLKGESKGVLVEFTVDGDVSDNVVGDVGRLRQIIINLVDNAIKFTNEGSVDVAFSNDGLEQSTGQMSLHVKVSDTGIGIPVDKQQSIFEAFTQVDMSTTRLYGGTGLGLTISNQLAKMMGGRIWCENNEGVGCVFHFITPLQTATETETADASTDDVLDPKKGNATKCVQSLKILLAEDAKVNQVLALAILNKLGHVVTVANNGDEAVQQWVDSPNGFDLILMDVLMPEKDGLEATRAIRGLESEIGSRIPIIAVTAQALEGDREACIQAGMDDYITKPIRQNDLEQAIARLFE